MKNSCGNNYVALYRAQIGMAHLSLPKALPLGWDILGFQPFAEITIHV